MSSGRSAFQRLRFDSTPGKTHSAPHFSTSNSSIPTTAPIADTPLGRAIARTRDYLLSAQHEEGYWVGELEGDTILESEYILLLAFLGRGQSSEAIRAANYIRNTQLKTGGWAIYPDGPLEINASVKAYLALKITGHSPDSPEMQQAQQAIRDAGGAEQVNSFTRYYLALLGIITYDKCPAVPPELMLLPKWMPLNIYEMSAWSRTILVPLSLLWAFRPSSQLDPDHDIRELFLGTPEDLPQTMPATDVLDELHDRHWIDWTKFFRRVDVTIKLGERLRLTPFRRWAIRKAHRWMLERFEDSDGLGAIFPPIIWSVIAMKCLGYEDDSPEVLAALDELKQLTISEDDSDRLQPCKSPVWDTAIATIALREANVPTEHPSMEKAVSWLLSKEVRQPGDWSLSHRGIEPSGWFFEFRNRFYPDVDDTGMVLMALTRCLPDDLQLRDFLLDDWSPHPEDRDTTSILGGRTNDPGQSLAAIDQLEPMAAAMHRAGKWVLAMQCRDGGWGAFDADNNREIFTRVPFADHNAMIDPSTSDLTARTVEMFAGLQLSPDHPAMRRAIQFVWDSQEEDHCWYGRWGVNYIYGTWQSLVGLTAAGISPRDARIQGAANWLKSVQQECGGWGESPQSYDDPQLRGKGTPTASQTAWALMGLLAAGESRSQAVERGVEFLVQSQLPDGTWQEDSYTGTGFPKVFYLKYHLYRVYFPLMALARYNQEMGKRT